jgi:trk/ktr system potassium uptake protein
MRPQVILRYTGFSLLLNGGFLFVASLVSAFHSDQALPLLLYSALISSLFGLFPMIFVPPTPDITDKEGLVIVVSSWLVCCLVGTLPYLLWGGEFTFTNAWFESVSGYTTTGSSILTNIETLPPGLLFWRSLTHWIGGIGILVFVLATLPFIAGVGTTLYRAEISSLSRETFRYRTRRATHILLVVYVGLTLVETVSLFFCGMSLFDAATHAFATVATGGFSPKNHSIAHYQSAPVEIIVIVFMVLSGVHFGLLFAAVSGNIRDFWKSSVVRYYIVSMLLGVLVVLVNVHGKIPGTFWMSLRYSAFQVISLGTSTGFATTDTTAWPPLAQLVLLLFTLQCACAGSTSGGIKVDRIVVCGKAFVRDLRRTLRPAEILHVKIDHRSVREEAIAGSVLYVLVYLVVVALSTLLLTAQGMDLISAFSGSAACMGNVGPGLGTVGSTANFAHVPELGKWGLSFVMLLGRLEIYGMLALFLPRFWKWA